MINTDDILERIVFKKTDLKFWAYLFITFIFLMTIGIRAVKGEIDFEFYGDSETYMQFMDDHPSMGELLLFYPNMIGPTIILTLVDNSFLGVYLINISITVFFYYHFVRAYRVNRKALFFFIAISPMFFSSIIAINKEMISILVITFFFLYYKRKSAWALILAVLFSFLVRWQMALFVFSVTFMLSPLNPLRKKPVLTLVFFLIFVSIVYKMNLSRFEDVNAVAERGADISTEGSGLFTILLTIQNSSALGYAIIFVPKGLFLFIGLIARYYNFLDLSDVYNNIVVFLQSVVHLVIIIMCVKKKMWFDNVFLFSAMVYFVIFSLSPIYAPRYLFPGYVLLALAIASTNNKVKAVAADRSASDISKL